METLASDYDYRNDAKELRAKIIKAAGEMRDSMREMEYRDAIESLEAAGFAASEEDEDVMNRGDHQVTVEMKRRQSDYWWEFRLEIAGLETLRGKSGEFAALLAAVGITQEVKK